jgi:hypothetical protein
MSNSIAPRRTYRFTGRRAVTALAAVTGLATATGFIALAS